MRNFVYVAAAVVVLSLTACSKSEEQAVAPEAAVEAPVAASVEMVAPAADMSATEVAPAAEQVATPEGSVAAE